MTKAYQKGREFELFNDRPIDDTVFDSIVEDVSGLVDEKTKHDVEQIVNRYRQTILPNLDDGYYSRCMMNYMMEYVMSFVWTSVFEKTRKELNDRQAENKANEIVKKIKEKYA